MSLLEAVLASLADAPGAGVGGAAAAAGTAAAAASESPQMCENPPVESEDEPRLPMSWESLTDYKPDPRLDDPAYVAQDSASEPSTSPADKYYSLQALRRYGKWLQSPGSLAERAGRAATGIVVLPIAAYAVCGEDTLRSYGIGKRQ